MIKMISLAELNLKDQVWYEDSVITNPMDIQVVSAVREGLRQLRDLHQPRENHEPTPPQSPEDLGIPRTFVERVIINRNL